MVFIGDDFSISISISNIRKCEVILLKLPIVSLSGASLKNEPELFLLAWRVDAHINFMEAFGAESFCEVVFILLVQTINLLSTAR